MSETISIALQTSYTVAEYCIRGPKDRIRQQLLSHKLKNIIGVKVLDDKNAALIYKCAICPHCGKRRLLKVIPSRDGYPSRARLETWATGQTSLFEECGEDSFEIPSDVILPGVLVCKNCGKMSERGEEVGSVEISMHRGKISITYPFENIFELLENADYSVITLCAPFIYNQTVTFNLHNGHTVFSISDSEGEDIYKRDITTCDDELFLNNGLPEIICLPNVRRAIRERFGKFGGFSFEEQSANFRTFVLAARFVGYPQDFYKKIPFLCESIELHPSFRKAARYMQNANRLPRVYEKMKLPGAKSVRREIFRDPALMFYARELKGLYGAIDNIDVFCKIFAKPSLYRVLASISCYPAVIDFVRDLGKAGMMNKIVRGLVCSEHHLNSFIHNAICYAAMSGYAKSVFLQRALNPFVCESNYFSEFLPSHPVHNPDKTISVGHFYGFDFEWLITTADYLEAGREMDNCLATYGRPAIVIKKDNKYVAALSIDRPRLIGDARLCKNISISRDKDVESAVEKWAKKNHMVLRKRGYEDEFDFDLFEDEEYA